MYSTSADSHTHIKPHKNLRHHASLLHRLIKGSIVPIAVFLFQGQVFAQSTVPPSVEPTRPNENFEKPLDPKSNPRARIPLVQEQVAPEGVGSISFDFQELRLLGAHAFSRSHLMALWPHNPGETIVVQDIFRFANAITRAYGEAGYALSFAVVPEQEIEGGIVTVQIVEGFISDVIFSGPGAESDGPVKRHAQDIADNVINARPLTTAKLERALLTINDLPGVKAASVLSAAPDVFAASILTIELEDVNPISIEAGYNNFLPQSLGRHGAGGTLTINGQLTGSDQFRFGGWKSIGNGAYWSVSGEASTNVHESGLRVGATGFYSESDPTDDFLEALEYNGEATNARLWADYPLIRTRQENLNIGLSASLSNANSDILGVELTNDRLRSISAKVSYDFADATRAVTALQLHITRGLDILDATGNSRANGTLTYTTLNFDAQRNQPIEQVGGGTLSILLSLYSQAALNSGGLFSAAECSYGGRRSGRAFDAGDLLGDHCALGGAELNWNRTLPTVKGQDLSLGLYGYIDGGLVWQRGRLQPEEQRERSAASAGGGLRFHFSNIAVGFVEASQRIKTPAGGNDDDFRINAGVTLRY